MMPVSISLQQSTLLLVLSLVISSSAWAREFRTINAILAPSPELQQTAAARAPIKPVSRSVINDAVAQIASAYNTPKMQAYLAQSFFDADRLSDTLNNLLPKDAVIRILSVREVQTLQQETQTDESSGQLIRVSRVAVTVNTQLEYSDPDSGFTTKPGITQYILNLKELAGDNQ